MLVRLFDIEVKMEQAMFTYGFCRLKWTKQGAANVLRGFYEKPLEW